SRLRGLLCAVWLLVCRMTCHPPRSTLFPYTTLFRSGDVQRHWPEMLLATSTHDTKRSEDVRSRIALLAQMPDDWAAAVRHLRERSEEHTSELQSRENLVCRLLLEKKKNIQTNGVRIQ